MHVTRLLVLMYIPTKYYQNMSKGIEVNGAHKDASTDGQMPWWLLYPPNLSVGG